MSNYTPEEIKSAIKAGFTEEEIIEIQEETSHAWENHKRLWDGRKQLPPRRRRNQIHRNINESWIPSLKTE